MRIRFDSDDIVAVAIVVAKAPKQPARLSRDRLRVVSLFLLAPVVQTSDSAIDRINHDPADSVIDFRNTYPLYSDLSGGQRYPTFEQPGPLVVRGVHTRDVQKAK